MSPLQQMVFLVLSGGIFGVSIGCAGSASVVLAFAPRTSSNLRAALWFVLAGVIGLSTYFVKLEALQSMPIWYADLPNTMWYASALLGVSLLLSGFERAYFRDARAAARVTVNS